MERLTKKDLDELSERVAFNPETTIQEDVEVWEIDGEDFLVTLQAWTTQTMRLIAKNPTPRNIEVRIGTLGYCMFQLGYICRLEIEMRSQQDGDSESSL